MRRRGHLFERVVAWPNLLRAARVAARGKRGRPEVAAFLFDLEPRLLALQASLADGSWRPGPFRVFRIRDPKPRTISAAPFGDRVVHHALMHVLDPLFDRSQPGQSYACRRGKGTHAAVAKTQSLCRRYRYVLKGDVEAFFETVHHGVTKGLVRRVLKDRRVLDLLDRIVDSGGCEDRGLPIGNLTSQYLANHVLSRLDWFVIQRLGSPAYLRYMDDFLVFGDDRAALHGRCAEIRAFLRDGLQLELKERATRVQPTHVGLPFLGMQIFPGTVRVDPGRLRRSRRRLASAERRLAADENDASARASSACVYAHLSHASARSLRRQMTEHGRRRESRR